MTSLTPYLKDALQRVQRLADGTLFTLNPHNKRYQSLYTAEEWANIRKRISVTTFGERFLKYIEDYNRDHGLIAEILEKLTNNRQPYRKVGPPASE
ncbi:MAG TPA: hypothetical protein VFZ09_46395 [Archangium sp.]|uniref:hypothetical protein n=1 Tax=Archangium sp. TaxID=1872627 RepID=UPI002E315485|nr:hypothetical protein [Archangium sp.]HEX5753709.1 hypothetical protein [Archangium sp.]